MNIGQAVPHVYVYKAAANCEQVFVPQSTEHKDNSNICRGFHVSSLITKN